MNRLSVCLLLAASIYFIDVSPAEAHSSVDRGRAHSYHYQVHAPRRHEMPGWLRHDRDFRHWYKHSGLRHHRQISWHQLLEIYRWERRYFRSRHYNSYNDDYRRDRRQRRHH